MVSPKGKETKDMKQSPTRTRYYETALIREDGKRNVLYVGKSYNDAKWAAYFPGESHRIIITQCLVKHSMNRNELGKTVSESVCYDSATDIIEQLIATTGERYWVRKNARAN